MCTVGDGQHSWNQCNFVNVGNVGRGVCVFPTLGQGDDGQKSDFLGSDLFHLCTHIWCEAPADVTCAFVY